MSDKKAQAFIQAMILPIMDIMPDTSFAIFAAASAGDLHAAAALFRAYAASLPIDLAYQDFSA